MANRWVDGISFALAVVLLAGGATTSTPVRAAKNGCAIASMLK